MFKSLNKLLLILDKENIYKFYFLIAIILTLSLLEIISLGLVLPIVTFLVNENSINTFKEYLGINFISNMSNKEVLIFSILLLLTIFIIKFFVQILFYKKQNQIVFNIMYMLSKKLFNMWRSI